MASFGSSAHSHLAAGLAPRFPAGDAAELINMKTPIWLLIAFGLLTLIPGLFIWHSLGRIENLFKTSNWNSTARTGLTI
jgi:hypothetical protein